MDEQTKLNLIDFDLLERLKREICILLLQGNVEKPCNSYAPARFIGRKKSGNKFQQFVYVSYKLKYIKHLFKEISSLCDEVFGNQPFRNVL